MILRHNRICSEMESQIRQKAPPNLKDTPYDKVKELMLKSVSTINNEIQGAQLTLIDVIDLKSTISKIENGQRQQLIVASGPHYTAVEIDKRNDPPRAIVLDAAGDPRSNRIFLNVSKLIPETFSVDGFGKDDIGGIQKDHFSCPLFTLDHCIQLATTDIYETMPLKNAERDDGCCFISWNDLPPNFVWNAQTIKRLEHYQRIAEEREPGCMDRQIPPYGITARQYLEQSRCEYPDPNSANESIVVRNEAINLQILSRIEEITKTKSIDLSQQCRDMKQELSTKLEELKDGNKSHDDKKDPIKPTFN